MKYLSISLMVVAGMCVGLAGAYVYVNYAQTPLEDFATPSITEQIADYARELITECADDSFRPVCYEEEVPKLLGKISSSEAFDLIREIRRLDPEYLYCHVLAHEIGEYEVTQDPEHWLDGLARGPVDGLCSNGFAHGAILARFNDEYFDEEEMQHVIPDLAIACEPREGFDPTPLNKGMCYHGMGHVLTHLTNAEIDRALAACEAVAVKPDSNYRQVCHEGVYMQLFQPLEPEDYALLETLPYQPATENIEQFCWDYSYSDENFATCWREAWPFFREQLDTGAGIESYCAVLPTDQHEADCLRSSFTINGRLNLGDPSHMAAVCNTTNAANQGLCFSVGANAYLEESQNLVTESLNFCRRADDQAAEEDCFAYLARFAAYNYHTDSAVYNELCTALPEPWGTQCYNPVR